MNTPIKIICPKHGEFMQKPRDHNYLNNTEIKELIINTFKENAICMRDE